MTYTKLPIETPEEARKNLQDLLRRVDEWLDSQFVTCDGIVFERGE